jgi:DNA-binding transcriptional ArsR family regulator
MSVNPSVDVGAASIAAAIGEPARARMLYCLLDGHARTGTELAIVAEVSPSTASAHLARLTQQKLIAMRAQGRHRYFSLAGASVARALEALTVIAGRAGGEFVPKTPTHLRSARTCYDHMAGHVAVLLRQRFEHLQWVLKRKRDGSYELTLAGANALSALGIDVQGARGQRRRFAYACIDWSERSPHIAGALGRALLDAALKQKWFVQDLDSRALTPTALGRRQLHARFGLSI